MTTTSITEYTYDTYETNLRTESKVENDIDTNVAYQIRMKLDRAILSFPQNIQSTGNIIIIDEKNNTERFGYIRTFYNVDENDQFISIYGCYYTEFQISVTTITNEDQEEEKIITLTAAKTYKLTTGNLPTVAILPNIETNGLLTNTEYIGICSMENGHPTLLMGFFKDTNELIIPPKSFFVEGEHVDFIPNGEY